MSTMSTTEVWQQYEQGVDYKTRIGLYRTVDLNERFFAGDQWVGVPHEGLPTPVVNFIRYASAWKIAAVSERRLAMQFFADGINDGGDIGIYAKQVSNYCDALWERLRMDYVTKEGLKQAAITGDYVQYFYWDPSLNTGQAVTGDIATQLIDNVNYYPGNPNTPDVQSQPYLILAFREMVDAVREEAKRNGCDPREIVPDEETEYTAGDRGKVEMDDGGKCNVLLKMYRKDGSVWCEKATRSGQVQPPKDTRLTRYPVALMNWDTRKNCCHGVAEVTGLIPNQVYVNKIMALSQLSQMQMSFPKVVYDRTRIREWTNKVAGAIPVNGDIGGAAQYLTPPGMAYDAWRGLDATLDKTMRMMGANDVTLGSIRNPDNTSAFIAARDAAMVPLQAQQERFYAFVEDVGLVWLDFIRSFYTGGRMIPVVKDGVRVYVPLPDGVLDEYAMRLKVEVGPSTMWSEIQVLQTLDNLLKGGKITMKQYLERLPDGHIPMKQELLAETAAEQEQGGAQGAGGAPGGGQAGMAQAMMAKMGAGGAAAQVSAGQAANPAAGASPAAQPSSVPASPGHLPPGEGMGGGQLAAVLKLVQAGAQSGDVKAEIAQAIGKLVQGGAGVQEIVKTLADAAQQGQVSQKFMKALTQAAGMNPASGPAAQPSSVPASPGHLPPGEGMGGGQLAAVLKLVQAGAQSGDVKAEIAQAIGKLVQGGAGVQEVVKTLADAAQQGQVSQKFIKALAQAVQGLGGAATGGGGTSPLQGTVAGASQAGAAVRQTGVNPAAQIKGTGNLTAGAGRASKRAAVPGMNIKRKAEKAMGIEGNMTAADAVKTGGRVPAADVQDDKAMLATLMELLQEGVQSGDVDADVPAAIGKLIESGMDAAAVLAALKQAAGAGKVSTLMVAKIEKLLNAPAAEEATDRTQILRGSRNQLTQ